MRCLYCGTEFWLPSRIRSDPDFCSPAHREKYNNRVDSALRLVQASRASVSESSSVLSLNSDPTSLNKLGSTGGTSRVASTLVTQHRSNARGTVHTASVRNEIEISPRTKELCQVYGKFLDIEQKCKANGSSLQNVLNKIFRCRHRRQTRPMTLNDETFAVCLDCGKRVSYDLQRLRSGNPGWSDNPGPKSSRVPDRAPALAIVGSGNFTKDGVDSGSEGRNSLAKGLGTVIGECVFAVNGPFLLRRLGLSVPGAAAIGCLVGAAVGYVLADFAMRWGNRSRHQRSRSKEALVRLIRHE